MIYNLVPFLFIFSVSYKYYFRSTASKIASAAKLGNDLSAGLILVGCAPGGTGEVVLTFKDSTYKVYTILKTIATCYWQLPPSPWLLKLYFIVKLQHIESIITTVLNHLVVTHLIVLLWLY